MIQSVIFITNKVWNPTFQAIFSVDFPEVTFLFIDSKEQLLGINDEKLHNSRLIAFFTEIIIPKTVLDKVSFGCYNFHPSTPNRRGWAPLNYALFEGDKQSGTTLSQINDKVDSGPIIGFDTFDVEPTDDYFSTNQKIFESAFKLFKTYRKRLFFKHELLMPMPISWGKHFKTKRDMYQDTIFDIENIDKQRLDRLVRAFGYTQELCLLRFSKDGKIYNFDHTKQIEYYPSDFELYDYKFFSLTQNTVPINLKA